MDAFIDSITNRIPGDVCLPDPLLVIGVAGLVVSQLPNRMSRQTQTGLMLTTCVSLISSALGYGVSPKLLEVLGGVAFLLHVPMMKRRAFVKICGAMLGAKAGVMMGYERHVMVAFAAIGLLKGLYRVYVLSLTLLASTPTPLVFGLVSHVLPFYSFSDHVFFRADNPPEAIAKRREEAFERMFKHWNKKWKRSIEYSTFLSGSFSDLRFAASNRVFLPFKRKLAGWCDPCTAVDRVDRVDLVDVDGQRLTDISGSYGVNVCGYDEYKKFISKGWDRVKDIGCVLGPVHPLLKDNIEMLKRVSGKDEVSFHMSGTEAVMCATRVARFNTGKPLIVVFGGAYHGWWDGVQPMAGNERVPHDVLTLVDMSPRSLQVIRCRASEIAAVVVNPLQAFHPNAPPPSDLVLTSNSRSASDSSLNYQNWLLTLKRTCMTHGVVLVFDEVYTGFRLAAGGAQEYFGIQADMVVYGKTLGGGMPIGVVCGPHELMCRTDPVKPLRAAYVIGTFAAHPLVLGAMNQFLQWATSKEAASQYNRLRRDVQHWVKETNDVLDNEFNGKPPIGIVAYSSVWTILYKVPGRYHWIMQYYLKDEGLNLSWVGTGRLSFSLDFENEDFVQVRMKIINACKRMQRDGWWWGPGDVDAKLEDGPSGVSIRVHLVKEILTALVKRVFS